MCVCVCMINPWDKALLIIALNSKEWKSCSNKLYNKSVFFRNLLINFSKSLVAIAPGHNNSKVPNKCNIYLLSFSKLKINYLRPERLNWNSINTIVLYQHSFLYSMCWFNQSVCIVCLLFCLCACLFILEEIPLLFHCLMDLDETWVQWFFDGGASQVIWSQRWCILNFASLWIIKTRTNGNICIPYLVTEQRN